MKRQSPQFKLQIIDGFFMAFPAKLRDTGVFPCCSALQAAVFSIFRRMSVDLTRLEDALESSL